MKVIVCGGRNYCDWPALERALDAFHNKVGITRLAHGDAPGADRMAKGWAKSKGIFAQPYPAEWKRYAKPGKKNPAGPIRNRTMYQAELPDFVIAFPGGDGTNDMVAVALAAGRCEVWGVLPERQIMIRLHVQAMGQLNFG